MIMFTPLSATTYEIGTLKCIYLEQLSLEEKASLPNVTWALGDYTVPNGTSYFLALH